MDSGTRANQRQSSQNRKIYGTGHIATLTGAKWRVAIKTRKVRQRSMDAVVLPKSGTRRHFRRDDRSKA
jgi:hypothetical protein